MVEQCLKLISRPGCEKIVRYAFEYAKKNNRKKVTCFVKDNIMKQTDGLFSRVFKEIAPEYPDITADDWIVDIGAAKLVDTPENFDVVVMPNLYGDILSDVTAQMTGSVGLAGSANIGEHVSMFEAIHGSAPRRAGQNLANPSGLFLGAIMMLIHINQPDIATLAHNAWLKTMKTAFTPMTFSRRRFEGKSRHKGIREAVVARLGQKTGNSESGRIQSYRRNRRDATKPIYSAPVQAKKELVGVDVFIHWWNGKFFGAADELGPLVEKVNGDGVKLVMISSRAQKSIPAVSPTPSALTTGAAASCRKPTAETLTQTASNQPARALSGKGFRLYQNRTPLQLDGKPGYALGQGQ
jgi:isocitrate dehydrogenase